MPEGDTIHRTAHTLARVLVGKPILGFRSRVAALARARLVGHRVVAVEAYGKNLMMRFDDGRALHSHMRMTGSWHVYRPGERWFRPEERARCVLEVEGFVVICFDAPVLAIVRDDGVAPSAPLEGLGPDILSPSFDAAQARLRLRLAPQRPVGEAILDQRAVAGIGNIYKSESLHRCRIDPFAAISAFDDATLDRLLDQARRLMRASVSGERVPRLVYRRRGAPCTRCGATIAMKHQGSPRRSTYYCPTCQPPRPT